MTTVIAFINNRKKAAHIQTMINAGICQVSDFQENVIIVIAYACK
jgi:hypothetical protein